MSFFCQTVELTKICDTKNQEIGKLNDEINTYRDYLEVRFLFNNVMYG